MGLFSIERLAEQWADAYPDHYSRSALRARGWTDSLVARFLSGADLLVPNPYYSHGADARLYERARVHVVERTDAFQVARSKSAERSARARSRYASGTAHDIAA